MPPPGELGHCYELIQMNRYVEARKRLEPIVADHPAWPRANLLLAVTYHKEGRYEVAKPMFERVLALDPEMHSTLPFYGWCLYYLGEAAESRKQFEAYLKIKPDYADAHYAIGLLELDRNNLAEAQKRFELTIRQAKAEGQARVEGKAHAMLGDVFVRLGELERAKQELELAVKQRTDAYEAYFMLSRVLQRLGDPEGAARAREMHRQIREQMHPSMPPVGLARAGPTDEQMPLEPAGASAGKAKTAAGAPVPATRPAETQKPS